MKNNVAYHRACRGRRPGTLGGPAAAPTAPNRGLFLLLLLAPLHVSTLQNNNRLNTKLIITFLKIFLTLKGISKVYYLPLGTRTLSTAGTTGRW